LGQRPGLVNDESVDFLHALKGFSGEVRRWPVGLARKALQAKAFYGTLPSPRSSSPS
jgi:hypothetical protein